MSRAVGGGFDWTAQRTGRDWYDLADMENWVNMMVRGDFKFHGGRSYDFFNRKRT